MKALRTAIRPLRLFVLTSAFIFVSLLGLVTGQSLAEPDVPTGLLERKGDKIVAAPAEDVALAKTYHVFKDKGRLVAGQRITIMTQKTRYRVGESVRVLHILEAVEPGKSVHLMGPKKVYDEYVDGKLATSKGAGKDPYRGMVADRPIADFNYEITTYAFTEPGAHTIQWKGGGASIQGSLGLESNICKLEVLKADAKDPSWHASLKWYAKSVISLKDPKTENLFYVESNGRRLVAFRKDGTVMWSVDVLDATKVTPKRGNPVIRDLRLDRDRLFVTFGMHDYAEVQPNTGKTQYLGSD
jgi:hypothetical protein